MPRKGEIRLSTSFQHIQEAVIWLEVQNRATPKPIRTILGGDAQQTQKSREALESFKFRLRRALNRKRITGKSEIKLNTPRNEVTAFQRCYDGYIIRLRLSRVPGRILALQNDIAKSTKPRGRPKLTSTQRAERLSKNYHIGDRQKPRIRKADRIAKRDAEWSRGLRLRRETILTDSVGRPKI